MNADKPIVILGFGRSGTTWLSDIISKYLGGLILFEPFHPTVYQRSSSMIYNKSLIQNDLVNYWVSLKTKQIKNRWLLRNHLNEPLDQLSNDFVNLVWSNSEIIGFKSIRMNFCFAALITQLKAVPLFIVRHPLAVISSILNRPNYWNDLSWNMHWLLFVNHTTDSSLKKIAESLKSIEEKIAFMWSLSHIIALEQLALLGVEPVFYEDLYTSPYEKTKEILRKMGAYNKPIHPSYLFTPSVSGLKTIHEKAQRNLSDDKDFFDFFWEKTLNPSQVDSINGVIARIAEENVSLKELCLSRNYL